MSGRLTAEERAEIRRDATFTAERVGAPGSDVRRRAHNELRLLDEHDADHGLLVCIATGFARRLPGSNRSVLDAMLHDVRSVMPADPSDADVLTQSLMIKALEALAEVIATLDKPVSE